MKKPGFKNYLIVTLYFFTLIISSNLITYFCIPTQQKQTSCLAPQIYLEQKPFNVKNTLLDMGKTLSSTLQEKYGISTSLSKQILDGKTLHQQINIGVVMDGPGGFELLGYFNQTPGVNVIYLFPQHSLIQSGIDPYATYGVTCNKKGEIKLYDFINPLALDHIVYGGLDQEERKPLSEINHVLLNSNETYLFSENKLFMKDTLKSIQLLPESKVHTAAYKKLENISSRLHLNNLLHDFITTHKLEQFVVKPVKGGMGKGIYMFSKTEISQAITYIEMLHNKGIELMIEQRIEPTLWMQDGVRQDHNLRVITVPQGSNDLLIDEYMIEVRYKPYDNYPVNKSRGANVMSLQAYFNIQGLDSTQRSAFIKNLRATIIPAYQEFQNACPGFRGGLLGWDLIQSNDEEFSILEINSGSVGGVDTLEEIYATEKKNYFGKVIGPIAKYIVSQAKEYQKKKSTNLRGFFQNQQKSLLPLSSSNHWTRAGNILLLSRNFKSAIHAFTKALELNPQNFSASWNLAESFRLSNNEQKFTKALQQTIDIDPEQIPLTENAAVRLIRIGRIDQAEQIIKTLLHYRKITIKRCYEIIRVFKMLPKKTAIVQSLYKAILSISTSDIQAWNEYARLSIQLSDLDAAQEAIRNLQFFLKDDCKTIRALQYQLAKLHLKKGDANTTETLLKKISANHLSLLCPRILLLKMQLFFKKIAISC